MYDPPMFDNEAIQNGGIVTVPEGVARKNP
jgi:hypothetical protein